MAGNSQLQNLEGNSSAPSFPYFARAKYLPCKNVLDLYRDGVWALVTMILSSCCVWTETTDSSSTIAFLTGFTVLRKSVTFEGWIFQ